MQAQVVFNMAFGSSDIHLASTLSFNKFKERNTHQLPRHPKEPISPTEPLSLTCSAKIRV